MKELNQITIKQLLASNTIGANNGVTNSNFSQIQEAILLINSAFGISIQEKTLNFPTGKINTGTLTSNLIKLPATGNTSIQLKGSNGEILANGINTINDVYAGRHLIVGDSDNGGRLKLILDRGYTDESIQPGVPGQIRFIGNDYEAYLKFGEVAASFSFDVNPTGTTGATGQSISVLYNGVTAGTTTWNINNVLTAQGLVDSIIANPSGPCVSSYNLNTVTISALPGLGASGNSDVVSVTGTIPVSSTGGDLSGGLNGTGAWFSILGSSGGTGATGPTGATGQDASPVLLAHKAIRAINDPSKRFNVSTFNLTAKNLLPVSWEIAPGDFEDAYIEFTSPIGAPGRTIQIEFNIYTKTTKISRLFLGLHNRNEGPIRNPYYGWMVINENTAADTSGKIIKFSFYLEIDLELGRTYRFYLYAVEKESANTQFYIGRYATVDLDDIDYFSPCFIKAYDLG